MKHGAGIYKVAKQLNCRSDEIVDFSSNINSYYPRKELTVENNMLVRYSDISYEELNNIVCDKLKIDTNQIVFYNGATAAIFELIKTLKPKDIYLYAPLYGEYEKASKEAGKRVYKIDRFKELYKKPKENSIVTFVNPSTPDGKYYDLTKLFKLWKKQNCTIVLDESFIEFEKLSSLRDEINSYKKLYIIQSFTKFYACAGVRIGAILSHKRNIKRFKTPLWHLSSFDVAFLSERLEDELFVSESRKRHQKNKKILEKILKKSKLFSKIYRSDTNFFLTKSDRAKEIFDFLLKRKILVRTCGSFDYLSDDYLRFGVKDDILHKKLKKGLKKFKNR
ncbi:MAG: aminotransferase class I/II-fold pyridoxal phosphate-dependent enzyme [Campylobacterota bacterium]|nr:aminotransferase class I/II-fold pyridoxal phosphate-dependent enzyme [Campylobacterota bacterium]